MSQVQRRTFLRTSIAASAAVGMGHLGADGIASRAWAADSKLIDPRVDNETERLVCLISETPREKAVGMMIDQVRQGISHRIE